MCVCLHCIYRLDWFFNLHCSDDADGLRDSKREGECNWHCSRPPHENFADYPAFDSLLGLVLGLCVRGSLLVLLLRLVFLDALFEISLWFGLRCFRCLYVSIFLRFFLLLLDRIDFLD